MTSETETASPAAGRNVGDVSDAKISLASETRESNSRNGVQGRVQGGHSSRGGHQRNVRRGGRFNCPAYTSSIRNFKGEVEDFGAVLGSTSEQIEDKDQNKKFREKLKHYILRVLQNP